MNRCFQIIALSMVALRASSRLTASRRHRSVKSLPVHLKRGPMDKILDFG